MHKRTLGFTNMSGASKGIRVSPTQCGDLALTLSGSPKENGDPVFQCTQSTLLKSFLLLSCTDKLFSKYTAGIADPPADLFPKDLLQLQHGRQKDGDFYQLNCGSPPPPPKYVDVLTSSTFGSGSV